MIISAHIGKWCPGANAQGSIRAGMCLRFNWLVLLTVFCARNIAASQVIWVHTAVWDKYSSKQIAVAAFERAKRDGAVRALN